MKKAGGHLQLEEGVKAKRIICAMRGNMQLFFFPRYEYSREQLYRQELGAEATQGGASVEDVCRVQDEQLGFHWDPSNIIPTCLEQSAQGLPGLGGSSVSGVPMVGGKSGVPMVGGSSQGLPMLPGFPLPMLGGSSTSTGVPMIGGSSTGVPMLGGNSKATPSLAVDLGLAGEGVATPTVAKPKPPPPPQTPGLEAIGCERQHVGSFLASYMPII